MAAVQISSVGLHGTSVPIETLSAFLPSEVFVEAACTVGHPEVGGQFGAARTCARRVGFEPVEQLCTHSDPSHPWAHRYRNNDGDTVSRGRHGFAVQQWNGTRARHRSAPGAKTRTNEPHRSAWPDCHRRTGACS